MIDHEKIDEFIKKIDNTIDTDYLIQSLEKLIKKRKCLPEQIRNIEFGDNLGKFLKTETGKKIKNPLKATTKIIGKFHVEDVLRNNPYNSSQLYKEACALKIDRAYEVFLKIIKKEQDGIKIKNLDEAGKNAIRVYLKYVSTATQ